MRNRRNILKEQKENTFTGPKPEIEVLTKNPNIKDIGKLVNLNSDNTGYPISVDLGGKKYFSARRTDKGNYILYDGNVAIRKNGKYILKRSENGSPVRVDGMDMGSDKHMELLNYFKIDPTDVYRNLEVITTKLQKLINQGYRSSYFKNWNELLKVWGNRFSFLEPKKGESTFEPPIQKSDLSNYREVNIGKQFGINPVFTALEPLNSVGLRTSKQNRLTKDDCESILTDYLINAYGYTHLDDRILPEKPKMMKSIRWCLKTNYYDDYKLDTTTITNELPINKKNSPFKKLFGSDNYTMDIRDIRRILSGKKRNHIDPAFIILENKMMKNIIRESLVELSNSKKQNRLQESTIVRNRFKVLIEGKKSFTKEETNKFFTDLIEEISISNSTGISKEIIQEELLSLLGTLFNKDDRMVTDLFKEKFAEWVSFKMVDVNDDIVSTKDVHEAIMNVKPDNVGKLIDCDFTSEIIAKTVVDGWKERLTIDGSEPKYVSEILRDTLRDVIDNSSFFLKVKGKIEKVLCPLLNGMEENMDDAAESIRTKVVES